MPPDVGFLGSHCKHHTRQAFGPVRALLYFAPPLARTTSGAEIDSSLVSAAEVRPVTRDMMIVFLPVSGKFESI